MKKTIAFTIAVLLILVLSFTIAACDKAKEVIEGTLSLEAPTGIKYDADAGQITWSAVANAESYTIRINEGETYPVTKTSFPYQATADTFTVTVTAKSTLASEEAVVTFNKLGAVEALSVDAGGVVSWTEVEGANAYAIAIDGSVVGNAYEPIYRLMPVGSHSVKVKPIVEGNDSYYASWSPSKTLNVLAQVSKDKIVYEDGYISWETIAGANAYVVLVNGQTPDGRIDGTRVPYDSENRNFSVSVQAIGDHVVSYDGKVSEQKDFVYLDTVTGVDVVNGALVWSAVNNADGYKIKLNQAVLSETFTACRYEGLVADQLITIQVMPVSNNSAYFANWSVEKNIQLLKKPVLQWEDGIALDGEAKNSIFWDAVLGASGYSVKVVDPTGKETVVDDFGEDNHSYFGDYLTVGEYKVSIQAKAPKTNSAVYDSVYSEPITVRRLAAPKQPENDFVISDPTALSEGFTLNFTKVAGATAYKLYKDGTELRTSTVNQFKVGDLNASEKTIEQIFNFKVQALGSISRTSSGTTVTLDSILDTSLSVNVKVLAVPTDLSISGKTLRYGAVAGNSGYLIAYGGEGRHSNETTCDMSFLNAGAYRVSVCAKGNGSTVLASPYTAALNVERLAAPTDIRILTSDSAEGQLSFSTVDNAASYAAVFDSSDEQIPVNKNDNIKSRITTVGTTLYMVTIADYQKGTVYYMSSRPSETMTFIKLEAPTFGEKPFSNTQFTWNRPSNINDRVFSPDYEVYEGIELQNGEITGTSMDISYLTAGSYVFKVKAIGNGTKYINSDESVPKSITKLQTPTVTRAHNAEGYGVYEWKAVTDGTEYKMTIDGVNKGTFAHETDKTYQFRPDFNRIKTYVVSVVAIGDDGVTTINSDPWTIEQKVDQLKEPDFEISYNADAFCDEGKIVVDITRESPYAVGYCYSVGGAEAVVVGEGAKHYEKCPSSVGTYKVAAYALGGDYDEEGTFYIDSQRHGGNSSYQITLLAEPNADSIKISQDGKLSWAATDGTTRYAITITVEGEEYLSRTVVSQANYLIGNYVTEVKGKNFKATVQAIGNGTTVISSKETTREFNA